MGVHVTQQGKQDFAEKVKAWREREGISQSGAAARLSIPKKTLQNWEIARTKPAGIAERLILGIIDPPPPKQRRRGKRS